MRRERQWPLLDRFLNWWYERLSSMFFVVGILLLGLAVTTYLLANSVLAEADGMIAIGLIVVHAQFSYGIGGGGLFEYPFLRRRVYARALEGLMLTPIVSAPFYLVLGLWFSVAGILVLLHVWLALTLHSLVKLAFGMRKRESSLSGHVPPDVMTIVRQGELTINDLLVLVASPTSFDEEAVQTQDRFISSGLRPRREYWRGFAGRKRLKAVFSEFTAREQAEGRSVESIFLGLDEFIDRWKLQYSLAETDQSAEWLLREALNIDHYRAEEYALKRMERKLASVLPT